MADFDAALASLLAGDGVANFGLTGNFLKLAGESVTLEEAAKIHRKYSWDVHRIGQIQDQRIADLFFHMLVTNPPKVVVMSLQLALQDVGIAVPATGFVGPKTTVAVNGAVAEKQLFIDRFKTRMLDRYKRLATCAADLAGWEARLSKL